MTIIYIKIIGGLGNQLFQYAFAENLKKKNKIIFKILSASTVNKVAVAVEDKLNPFQWIDLYNHFR